MSVDSIIKGNKLNNEKINRVGIGKAIAFLRSSLITYSLHITVFR